MSLKTPQWINPNRIDSVGLDVSKDKITICLMSKETNSFYEIKNNSQDINEFCKYLSDNKLKKSIPIIIESTWDYHLLCSIKLSKLWYSIKEINPIITKHYVSHNIRWTKTDKTDSETLAKIWVIEWSKLRTFTRPEEYIQLKKKLKLIASLETQIQSINASINWYKKTFKTLWFKQDKSILELEKIVKKMNLKIKEIEKEIEDYKFNENESKQIESIDSIVWISTYIAKVCFVEFANIKFNSKGSMLAFIWLDPKLKQSWNKNTCIRISKRWSSYIRKKLFQAWFCAIQHSNFFKSIYNKAIQKWKHHFVWVIAVIKKMIYIMRSLLKNGTMFNENFDKNLNYNN